MSENFLGEIRLFSSNFPPKGWAACEGQLLPINQNQALFSLLGTAYGGNGTTTFALPDLRGRVPLHFGAGISRGTKAGETAHTLTTNEMPQHNHTARASDATAGSPDPSGRSWAQVSFPYQNATNLTSMHPGAIANSGQSQPHNNMQPYQSVYFCIALQGVYPTQN